MTKHLKRYFSPKSWKIKRKGIVYVTKPSPGPHRIGMALPLNVILRDVLGYAATNREVKFMLGNRDVTVDGIKRRDPKFPVGLFDVLSLNDVGEHFRVILDKKGSLALIRISKEESGLKLCKIIGKRMLKGKAQLNLYDGKNIFVEKDSYKCGDSVLVSLDSGGFGIKDHLKLANGSLIFLTGGKHIGEIGNVQDIAGARIIYKAENGDAVETLKKYAFPVGKDKPLIKLGK
ncbi:30S ribosomal protein S4e [Candidatus Woesearchaeota archaeon]|nr:30S ribosomal protein S4e [Candidatus Woesearchaeota archaeon]